MDRIGDYKIIKRIGAGGMGEVWLGENVHMHLRYAIKLLPREATADGNFVARFFDEGRVMAELDHPNIVQVHHVGHDAEADRYYLVMDYICGEDGESSSLHDLLERAENNRTPQADARKWSLQIADALAYAHKRGVVHRDIKPANILIDKNGDAKVTDFGLAKLIGDEFIQTQIHNSIQQSMAGGINRSIGDAPTIVDPAMAYRKLSDSEQTLNYAETLEDGGSNRTTAESLLGTYDYMAPEQRNDLPGVGVTPASDIYSFGVMLYRILTGRRPVGRAKTVSATVPGLSKNWDVVTDRCLEHIPTDRYADGAELLTALQHGKTGSGVFKKLFKAAVFLTILAGLAYGGLWGYGQYQANERHKTQTAQAEQQNKMEQARIAKLEAAKRARIRNNLKQAYTKLADKDYQAASATVATVLADDPNNSEARAINEKIAKAAGLDAVIPVRAKAKLAYQKVQKLDTASGFGAKLEALKLLRETADEYYAQKSFGRALTKYQEIVSQCKRLAELDTVRKAKQIWENEWGKIDSETREKLKDYGGVKYGEVYNLVTGNPAAGDYIKAARHLPDAVRFAQAGHKQAKYDGLISQARGILASMPAKTEDITASQRGELKTAAEAVENALSIKPSDTTATALLGRIKKMQNLALDLGGGVSMKLVKIPAGSFMMGSPASETKRFSDEGPHRRVTIESIAKLSGNVAQSPSAVFNLLYFQCFAHKLPSRGRLGYSFAIGSIGKPFYMGIYEVTQEQYQAIMGSNPSAFKGTKRPMECVSWNDAVRFCIALSRKTGRTVRLPTEAQWEYACRAGSGRSFCFGGSNSGLGSYAWHTRNSGGRTHPVGQKQPNAFGLYDMHGNVWEWCNDWYDENYYAKANNLDPQGPGSGRYRVLRGGSWGFGPRYCWSANRDWNMPGYVYGDSGFRVVVLDFQ